MVYYKQYLKNIIGISIHGQIFSSNNKDNNYTF